MNNILLTSIGLTSRQLRSFVSDFKKRKNSKTVLIITTANTLKEFNPLALLTYAHFLSIGFKSRNIFFHDIEKNSNPKTETDILFVCGGNSFELLYQAQKCNFKEYIRSIIDGGGLYIGSSAGSILLAPSVFIASQINPDRDKRELQSYSGLNVVNTTIFPHYKPKYEFQIRSFEIHIKERVVRVSDGQGALCDENKLIKVIG